MIPTDSIRGCIRAFLERNAHYLASPILEVGSLCKGSTFRQRPWMDNRTLRPDCAFLGVDMEAGEGVDEVWEIGKMDFGRRERYGSLILSEVLEHVRDLDSFLDECAHVVKRDAHVLVTVPFAHHVHGFPDDYWRFTPEGLRVLFARHGFKTVSVEELAHVYLTYSDHGEKPRAFKTPRNLGAVMRRS